MIIKNLSNEYEVIRKIKGYAGNAIFLCSYIHAGKIYNCEIIQLKDMAKDKGVISYFNEILLKRQWDDLIECFVKEEALFVVVKSHPYGKLVDQIRGNVLSLPERVHIMENLCERMILQEMPPYIMYDGLKKEHVVINPHLDVYMHYELDGLYEYYEYSMKDVCLSFYRWLKLVFQKEFQCKNSRELEQLGDRLKRREFFTYMEIYKAYMKASGELLKLHEEGTLYVKHSWTSLMWGWIKKTTWKLRYMFMWMAVLLLLLASVLYYKSSVERAAVPVAVTEQIGSIQIEDGVE